MKKFLLLILSLFMLQSNAQINDLYLVLDASKLGFGCNLNGATTVWMHSGACTSNEADCNSLSVSAWENMAPVDWGAGTGYEAFTFVDSSSGLYYLTLNLADAYTVSTPVYSIGLIFRDDTGAILGQDPNCGDIFITNIQDESPQVFESDGGTIFDGVIATNPLSIKDNSVVNNILVYPNPTQKIASVLIDLNSNTELSIVVYNAIGQQVDELFIGDKPKGFHKINWNNSAQKSGLYFIVVKTPTANTSISIVKK